MSQTITLKPGWKIWRFDQMATNVNVRIDNPSESGMEHYVGLEHLDPDSLRIRRWGSPDDVEATKLMFKKGDIIFGRRRAYQRKLGVAEFDGICSAHAMVLRAKPEVVLPEFLPFFMQSDLFMNRAVEISVGSLSPTINWKTMAIQEFALPPIEEQQHTAERLGTIRNSIDAYDNVFKATEQLLGSFAAKHFSSDTSQYPTVKLEQTCLRITDGTHQPPKFSDSGIPFLLVSNLSSGKVDWTVEKWISDEEYAALTRSFKPQRGDVLLTLVGSFGVPVFVDWDQPFSFQRHVGIVRTDESKLRGRYLVYFLRSPVGQWFCTRGAQGLAQKTITLTALKDFEIPLTPVDVQDEFIRKIEAYEISVGLIEARNKELCSLFKIALNDAAGGSGV